MSDYQQSGPPVAGGPAHNGFFVEGVVVRDPHQDARFSALTVREGEKSYWDVMCWEDGPLTGFRELKGGDLVRIEGKLGKRKNKKSGEWEISLSATGLRVAPRQQQAAPPPPPPQYQAPPQQNWGHAAANQYAADWGPVNPGPPPPWGQR